MAINKAIIIGHCGSDPEVRTLQSGEKVAGIRVATTEKFKDQSGNLVENTEWHRVELWGRLAEIAEQYVKKGDQIYIEGKIKTDKYTDAQGVEKYATKIRATSLQMLNKKLGNGEAKNSVQNPATGVRTPAVSDDEDLPF